MNIDQKRELLKRIAEAQNELKELQRVRFEIAQSGTASASLASGGGSKSYTRLDLDKLSAQISQLVKNIARLRELLTGQSHLTIKHIYRVYG